MRQFRTILKRLTYSAICLCKTQVHKRCMDYEPHLNVDDQQEKCTPKFLFVTVTIYVSGSFLSISMFD